MEGHSSNLQMDCDKINKLSIVLTAKVIQLFVTAFGVSWKYTVGNTCTLFMLFNLPATQVLHQGKDGLHTGN